MVIWYIPQLGLVGLLKYTNVISDGIREHTYAILILGSLVSYLVIFHFYWKPRPNYKSISDIKNIDTSLFPYLFLIVIGMGFVSQPIFDFEKIIDFYNTSEVKSTSHKFAGISALFVYFRFSSLFIAPLFEELFFRKFLFTKLLEYNKVWLSVIISSLCFSAIHFETPYNLLPTFIYGVIACIIYMKTKNICYLIIIHFMYNLVAMLYSVYGEHFYNWVYDQNYRFMYWALFVFGILLTALGLEKITSAKISMK